MRAVILAGGKGTRMRPYTTVLPKPLLPIGEQPIVELIIRQLARSGFRVIDLSVGHLGQLIRTYLDEIELPDGVELRYWFEDSPLGTAGALHRIEGLDEPFLAMNGDILTTIDYGALMEVHRGNDALLTIAAKRQDVEIELGVIESEDGAVDGYIEKPTHSYDVSMGIYAYDPGALEFVPHERFDFPDLVKALLAAGKPVAVHVPDATWFDIGTPTEHERAIAEIEAHPELFDE